MSEGSEPSFPSGDSPHSDNGYQSPVFPGYELPVPDENAATGGFGRRRATLVAIVVGAIVVVAIAAVTITTSGSDSDEKTATAARSVSQGSGAGATTGGSAPTDSAPCTGDVSGAVGDVRGDGQDLVADITLSSPCPDGQVISAAGVGVTLASAERTVAGATFDFSSNPVHVTTGSTVSLRFGPMDHWALPTELDSASTAVSLTQTNPSQATPGDSVPMQSTPPRTATLLPPGGNIDVVSGQALQQILQDDRASVQQSAAERWVPQVSSKRPGLNAEGKIWRNADILEEQYQVRARFPQTRLVWTSDWSAFDLRDWWVTVLAIPFDTPEGANGWCVQQRLDRDHCFAKRLARNGDSDGTTVLQD